MAKVVGKHRHDSLAAGRDGAKAASDYEAAHKDYLSKLRDEANTARQDALLWIERHRPAWHQMEQVAFERIERDLRRGLRPRISIAHLVEIARAEGLVGTNRHEQFGINNNIKAALARILVEDHPEWREYITMRRSRCDWSFQGKGERDEQE